MGKKLFIFKKVILTIICILLIFSIGLLISNKFNSNYDDLNDVDKSILSQLDLYFKSEKKKEIWEGFKLSDKTVVAIDGIWKKAYVVNPKENISYLFGTKIKMPKNSNLNVYRVSVLDPHVFSMRFDLGNFNTLNRQYNVYGKNSYYTRYNKESVYAKNSSRHYITFLNHESFHYYMQNNWADGSRFLEDIKDSDIELIKNEYDVLSNIQSELFKKSYEKDKLIKYAKEYVNIINKRKIQNPDYLKAELSMETAEGSAEYVGIKASQCVGYDFGVMYFNNVSNVSFNKIIPLIKSKQLPINFLSDRMPYETGALLCQLLDALEIKDWQDRLNKQTIKKPLTIDMIISEYVDNVN